MKIKYSLNSTLLIHFFLLCIAFFNVDSFAQISGGEIKPDKSSKEKAEREKSVFVADSVPATSVYVSFMGQYAFRNFEDKSVYSIYDQELNEKPIFANGYTVGLVLPLSEHFGLDAGVSYFNNGEAYLFEDEMTDSSFSYKNVYTQFGIPLKLRYTVGNRFQFFGFAGITPLNIINIRRTSSYIRANGASIDLGKTTIKNGFTTFNLMASGGLGLNYYFNSWGVHLTTEYRRHLLNTYSESTFKREHFMYGFAVNLGLQLKI